MSLRTCDEMYCVCVFARLAHTHLSFRLKFVSYIESILTYSSYRGYTRAKLKQDVGAGGAGLLATIEATRPHSSPPMLIFKRDLVTTLKQGEEK